MLFRSAAAQRGAQRQAAQAAKAKSAKRAKYLKWGGYAAGAAGLTSTGRHLAEGVAETAAAGAIGLGARLTGGGEPDEEGDAQGTSPQGAQGGLPEGMVAQGNINLTGRPIVHNDDGSISTEYSTSFGDDQGHEILVPTVVNGKFLTPDGKKPPEGSDEEKQMFKQAQQHYENTGEQMGVFDSPEHADAYAKKVHEREMKSSGDPVYVYREGTGKTDSVPQGTKKLPSQSSQSSNKAQAGGETQDTEAAASKTNIWQKYPSDSQLAAHIVTLEGGTKSRTETAANNPGGLMDTKTGKLRQFKTREEGMQALFRDIDAKRKEHPNWTVADFNRAWSPDKKHGGNNPDGTEASRNRFMMLATATDRKSVV